MWRRRLEVWSCGDVEEEAVRLEERMGGDRARGRRKGTVSLVFGVGRGVELGLEESGVSGEETRPEIRIALASAWKIL